MMTDDEKAQLARNTRMTAEIHQAVVGNPELGHVGLVAQVQKVQQGLDDHEEEDRTAFEQIREMTRKIDGKVSKIFVGLGTIMICLKVYEAIFKK